MIMENYFENHLRGRMGPMYDKVIEKSVVDWDNEIITFYLWNLSGQLKGFQRYNWKGSKKNHNSVDGKYFSVSKSGLSFFGLDYFDTTKKTTYICEGIFDAISLMQFGNALAVLTNDPKHLSEQLSLLPGEKVAVCDDGKAGLKLSKFGDSFIICDKDEDPNSLSYQRLKFLLRRG